MVIALSRLKIWAVRHGLYFLFGVQSSQNSRALLSVQAIQSLVDCVFQALEFG